MSHSFFRRAGVLALLAALLTPGDESLVPASTTVVVVTHRPEAVPADTPVLRIGEPR